MITKEILSKNLIEPCLSNRVYYEITSVCNLKCTHCSDLLQASHVKYLPTEKILKFNEEISKKGITNSVVTGGEPTLHKGFYEIVTGLVKTGQVLITSNGTLLELDRMAELLKKNRNVTLQISMDGISKTVFEAIRGENTFDLVMKTIDYLTERKLNKQLGISMTIMEQNRHEIEQMIKFAKDKKIDYVHFPVLLPVGVAKKKWDKISPSVENQISVENQLLEEMIVNDSETRISSNRVDQILTRVSHGAVGDCLQNITLKITPEGFVLPCPAASDPKCKIGDIDEENLIDTLMERIKKRLVDYTQLVGEELQQCKECKAFDKCLSRFCANCGLLSPPSKEHVEYYCKIFKYHYINAIKEINE